MAQQIKCGRQKLKEPWQGHTNEKVKEKSRKQTLTLGQLQLLRCLLTQISHGTRLIRLVDVVQTTSIKMAKKGDFKHVLVVGPQQAGRSLSQHTGILTHTLFHHLRKVGLSCQLTSGKSGSSLVVGALSLVQSFTSTGHSVKQLVRLFHSLV